MREIEINLGDLLVEILLRWRMIIVWMMVGGVLLGGLSFVSSYREAEAQKAQKSALEQQLQEMKVQLEATQQEESNAELVGKEYLRGQLTEQQENNVDRVINYEQYSANLQAYVQSSVLMQLDARKVPKTTMTFWVNAENEEKSVSIEKAYEDKISTGFVQWLVERKAGETDASVLSELITLSRSSNGILTGSDSFRVSVVHLTEEKCDELAEQLIDYIEEQQEALQALMGTHTIEVVDRSYVCTTDINLLKTQQAYKRDIIDYISSASELKTKFTTEQWQYYKCMAPGESEQIKETSALLEEITVTTPSVSSKYIILGMILLPFAYIFYVLLGYILNKRIRVSDNVKEIYDIPQLAVIPNEMSVKKTFALVDHWILKLRNRNKRTFSEEEAIGLAAVAVKIQAKKEGVNEVYCIGCNLNEKSYKIAEKIQYLLKEDNISLKVLNNVLYNQESLDRLQEARAVFLLERAGETLYDEMAQELELLQRQDIRALGAVVVE